VKVKDKVEDVALDFPLPSEYLLATIHRAENTASSNLKTIFDSLCNIDHKIIIPLHPRTKKRLKEEKLFDFVNSHLIIIDPLGYLHFTKLLQNAKAVITDSGGVQKEAYWNHVPCVTVRDNTEWIETVNANGNILSQPSEIGEKLNYMLSRNISFNDNLYGFDDTSRRILTILENFEE
ncbi:MAG: UDP-N-acetylglucosamine 2-epimerase, partial [Asgard group archaeon]|nr:UDP-N-acetylglucosamine 2-epimerase [Asgard group archaeon]